jgi:hypothetical protein
LLEPIQARTLLVYFNFANYKQVNDVFTALLRSHEQFVKTKFDFFGAIKKIYWYDPPTHPRGKAPNDELWNKFEIMFDIRNDIIHHVKYANLPTQEIFFLCEHTLNIADIASYLSMLPEMNDSIFCDVNEHYSIALHLILDRLPMSKARFCPLNGIDLACIRSKI